MWKEKRRSNATKSGKKQDKTCETYSQREGGEWPRNRMKKCDRRLGFEVEGWKLSGLDLVRLGHVRALGTRIRICEFGVNTIMVKACPSPWISQEKFPNVSKGKGTIVLSAQSCPYLSSWYTHAQTVLNLECCKNWSQWRSVGQAGACSASA